MQMRAIAFLRDPRILGDTVKSQVMYHLSGERGIPPVFRGDANKEYELAKQLTGEHFPEDGKLDEFGLSLATALHDGYADTKRQPADEQIAAERVIRLQKKGSPTLVLVKPRPVEPTGLESGLWAVAHLHGLQEGSQFVLVTNGQYCPKDEIQANRFMVEVWATGYYEATGSTRRRARIRGHICRRSARHPYSVVDDLC